MAAACEFTVANGRPWRLTMLSGIESHLSKRDMRIRSCDHDNQLGIGVGKEFLGCTVVPDAREVDSTMASSWGRRWVLWRFCTLQEGDDLKVRHGLDVGDMEVLRATTVAYDTDFDRCHDCEIVACNLRSLSLEESDSLSILFASRQSLTWLGNHIIYIAPRKAGFGPIIDSTPTRRGLRRGGFKCIYPTVQVRERDKHWRTNRCCVGLGPGLISMASSTRSPSSEAGALRRVCQLCGKKRSPGVRMRANIISKAT